MNLPLGVISNGIDIFLLVFVRMTGLFVIAPIFGRRNVPVYFKIGFSFLSALLLINTVTMPKPGYNDNIYQYSAIIFREFIVGVTIGYVSFLVFTAIHLAGEIIDMQVGFGMVNVLDPMSNIQVSISSNFYFILCMMVFLGINGHHLLIKALFDSYQLVPLGTAVFDSRLMDDILRIFGNIFVIGFKISAPVVAAVFISDIALGVIAKSVPQLNVFIVGMPLKIALGVAIMLLSAPIFVMVAEKLIYGMNADIFNLLKDMGMKK